MRNTKRRIQRKRLGRTRKILGGISAKRKHRETCQHKSVYKEFKQFGSSWTFGAIHKKKDIIALLIVDKRKTLKN